MYHPLLSDRIDKVHTMLRNQSVVVLRKKVVDTATLVKVVDAQLAQTPYVRPGGSLLIMVGLPGTGKSSLVETMRRSLPCVVVTTEKCADICPEKPTYTTAEKVFIYEVGHALAASRLRQGQRVVFDGTNYVAAQRQKLYALAEQVGATLAICHVQVAKEIARQRLVLRLSMNGGPRICLRRIGRCISGWLRRRSRWSGRIWCWIRQKRRFRYWRGS